MSKIGVVFFSRDNGTCPLLMWLDGLPAKFQDKCVVRIERLAELGYDLRRPEADYLRDEIYKLRTSFHSVQYRMLYFCWDNQAVVSHGVIKKRAVPASEINLAVKHKPLFGSDPKRCTYREENT